MIFHWQNMPYGRSGVFTDVKGGRLSIVRDAKYSRYFVVRWNARKIGVAKTIDEGKEMAERLYKDGLL